jgi:uncharacterized protein (TIRG00374 family)
VKFIVYQTVLTLYSLFIFLFRSRFFRENLSHFFYLAWNGFLVNAAVILMSVLFSHYKSITHTFLVKIYQILKWMRLVKDPEIVEKKMEEKLENFHKHASIMKKNRPLLLKTTVLTILQLTMFFIIPYCIYRSFGMNEAGIVNMIAAKAFVLMVTSFIPLPGASGGAEGSFYLFFGLFFRKENILSAILLWRIITFYSCILFGGLTTVLAPEKPLKSESRSE